MKKLLAALLSTLIFFTGCTPGDAEKALQAAQGQMSGQSSGTAGVQETGLMSVDAFSLNDTPPAAFINNEDMIVYLRDYMMEHPDISEKSVEEIEGIFLSQPDSPTLYNDVMETIAKDERKQKDIKKLAGYMEKLAAIGIAEARFATKQTREEIIDLIANPADGINLYIEKVSALTETLKNMKPEDEKYAETKSRLEKAQNWLDILVSTLKGSISLGRNAVKREYYIQNIYNLVSDRGYCPRHYSAYHDVEFLIQAVKNIGGGYDYQSFENKLYGKDNASRTKIYYDDLHKIINETDYEYDKRPYEDENIWNLLNRNGFFDSARVWRYYEDTYYSMDMKAEKQVRELMTPDRALRLEAEVPTLFLPSPQLYNFDLGTGAFIKYVTTDPSLEFDYGPIFTGQDFMDVYTTINVNKIDFAALNSNYILRSEDFTEAALAAAGVPIEIGGKRIDSPKAALTLLVAERQAKEPAYCGHLCREHLSSFHTITSDLVRVTEAKNKSFEAFKLVTGEAANIFKFIAFYQIDRKIGENSPVGFDGNTGGGDFRPYNDDVIYDFQSDREKYFKLR